MSETQTLEDQIADLQRQLAEKQEAAAVADHFTDSEGNPLGKDDINDAMLRSIGTAIEARSRTFDWQERNEAEIAAALAESVNQQDYIGVAMFAGIMSAKRHLT